MRKGVILVLLGAVAAALAALLLARLWSYSAAQGRIYSDAAELPHRRMVIVFGAGVYKGLPTPMLADRVVAAVELYKAGVVDKLLVSGDNRTVDYNEPAVMRRVALEMGVPDADIVPDYAGRSTYDTCYRAKAIFGVNEAILVTQRFHLDRAVMICQGLGLQSVGFVADQRDYRNVWWNELRELPATLNAIAEVYITKPRPVLGEKLEIR
jgi:SanA protein